MSPFKEPQPRKNSVEKDGEKVIGGNWPPYERLGSEARWNPAKETGKLPEPDFQKPLTQLWAEPSTNDQWSMTEAEFDQSLEDAREEGREQGRAERPNEFDYRLAALQQSVSYWSGAESRTSSKVVNVAQTFETFLRDGRRI